MDTDETRQTGKEQAAPLALRLDDDTVERLAKAIARELAGLQASRSVPTDATISTKEAAKLLGYTNTKAFTQAVKRDLIPCVRVNARVIRYDAAELERWLKGGIAR